MDRSVDAGTQNAIRDTIAATCGVVGLHDLKTRKAGDLILVDVHIEVPGELSVRAGHAIALAVRENVLARHEVLQVMIHIDPYEAPGGELAHA